PAGRPPSTRASANSTSTSAINTAAAPKPRATIVFSGEREKTKVASGKDTIGPENRLKLRPEPNPAVISTGDVSPSPRAAPSNTAVVRPERAVGNTTCQTVLSSDAPIASDASRSDPGTSLITTSEARMMIGNIITLMASPAANPDLTSPRARIAEARMNSPATMEGSAVIASTTVRTNRASGPLVSLRYTAPASPSGTVMINAMVISMRVPVAACTMPPTVSGYSG